MFQKFVVNTKKKFKMKPENQNPTMSKIIVKNNIEQLKKNKIKFIIKDFDQNLKNKNIESIDFKIFSTKYYKHIENQNLVINTKNKNEISSDLHKLKPYDDIYKKVSHHGKKPNGCEMNLSDKNDTNNCLYNNNCSDFKVVKLPVTLIYRGFGKRYAEFDAKINHEKNIYKNQLQNETVNVNELTSDTNETNNNRTYNFYELLNLWKTKTDTKI